MNKTLLLAVLFVNLLLPGQNAYSRESVPDIETLSVTETKAWKAYYEQNAEEMFSCCVKIFEIQYDFTPLQAKEVVLLYGKAAASFDNLPSDTPRADYQTLVLPLLIEAYAVLNSYAPMKDYESAAQFDLQWWVDRRDPQTSPPVIVGSSMAKMYAAMDHDTDIPVLEKAGYLRAAAAQYLDFAHSKWGGRTQEDWTIVQQILLKSYQVLYQTAP